MTTQPALLGVHHVSSLSAHIDQTHAFYSQVLGLRLLIKTVNQDDTSMYHLFYGDGAGTPGSDITIFDLPNAAPERRGNNSITRTTFRVHGMDALRYWVTRLDDLGIVHSGITERDGRSILEFDDSVGTQLALIDDGGFGDAFPWAESPIPPQYQIRGLGYVMVTVPTLERTDRFLTEALGLRLDRQYALPEAPQFTVFVYAIGEGGPHAEVHVVVRDDLPRVRYGSGGVHHVALRTPAGQSMAEWVERLNALGYRNSGVVDRHYFVSAYVREPNGILFEIATDDPGFEVDGPIDAARLTLPPVLEPRRTAIEAGLKPLQTAVLA